VTRLAQIKLALAGIGLVLLIWGMRVDDPTIRLTGIGFLAASFLTRFLPRRLRDGDPPPTEPPAT
jgi:hypothetical protein